MEEYIYNGEGTKVVSYINNEIRIYDIKEKYLVDKNKYLITGSWPNIIFDCRDDKWEYYYYLQLMDKDLNLEKYLDFNYDINKWNCNDIIGLINEYGLGILLAFYIYSNIDTYLSFDEWYIKYQNHLCIPTMINNDGERITRK